MMTFTLYQSVNTPGVSLGAFTYIDSFGVVFYEQVRVTAIDNLSFFHLIFLV